MKRASKLLALGALIALPCCVTHGADPTPREYLRDVRIVRVVPAPWYSGITATLGKLEVEDQSGVQSAVYLWDTTQAELDLVPKAGEICTIVYVYHVAKFHWITGDGPGVETGEHIMMGESAACGANSYKFRSAFGARHD